MGKLGTVVAVFAVLLVYFAESKTDGSDSAKSKPFLVDGKEMHRLSPQESYGHADDKDEKRFKLTDKKSSVEKNERTNNPGEKLDGKDRSTVKQTSTNFKANRNGEQVQNRRSKNQRRSRGKKIQKRPIGYRWLRSQRG